jgi:hypothetical protein
MDTQDLQITTKLVATRLLLRMPKMEDKVLMGIQTIFNCKKYLISFCDFGEVAYADFFG